MRLFSFFIVSFCFSIILNGQVPSWDWASSINSTGEEITTDIVVDVNSSDIYVVGNFGNNLSAVFSYNGMPGTDFSTPYGGGIGNYDGFVAKYHNDGTLEWAFKIGTANVDSLNSISVDQNGDIYITGSVATGVSQFTGFAPSLTNDSTYNNLNESDFFIAKYNSNGALLWVRKSDGTDNSFGKSIFATSDAVYAVGSFQETLVLDTIDIVNSRGSYEFFIVKYNSDGGVLWAIEGASAGVDYANDLYVDGTDLFIVGEFSGPVLDLYNSSGTLINSIPNSDLSTSDIALIGLSTEGEINWVNKIGTAGNDFGRAITFIGDSIYLTGGVNNNCEFPDYSPNPSVTNGIDIFISSHGRTSGSTGWVKIIECTTTSECYASSITRDARYNLTIGGRYSGALQFGADNLAADGIDGFVAYLSGTGKYIWSKNISTSGSDGVKSVSANGSLSLTIAGGYENSMNLDGLLLQDADGTNAFLAKLDVGCEQANGGFEGPTCQYEFVLNASAPVSGLGVWTDVDGATFSKIDTTTPTVIVDTSRVFNFVWTIEEGECLSRDTITIVVDRVIAKPQASDDGCGQTYQLSAIPSPNTTSRKWNIVSNPGGFPIIENDTSPTGAILNATNGFYGDYQIRWEEERGTCFDDSIITITLHEYPTANAGFASSSCGLSYELGASLQTGNTGEWIHFNDIGNIDFADSSISNTLVTVDSYINHTFYWVESTEFCSDTASVSVWFIEEPVARAFGDTVSCGNNIILTSNPSIGTGNWSIQTGSGSPVLNQTDSVAIITVDNYDSYTFKWSENNAGCIDDTLMPVTFYEQPILDEDFTDFSCDTIYNLNSSISVVNSEHYWSLVSGNGQASYTDSTSNSTLVSVDFYENYIFQWKEVNKYCSDSQKVSVYFYEQPVSNIISNDNTCGRSADLNALPSVGEGTWSFLSGPALPESLTKLNDSTSSVLIADGQYAEHTFQWKEVNGVCSDSTQVSFSFIQQPIAVGGEGGEVCDNNFLLTAVPSVGDGEWIVVDSIGMIDFLQGRNVSSSVIQVEEYGNYTFQWVEVNDICIDSSNDVSIVFNEQPDVEPFEDRFSCGLNFVLTTDYSVEGSSGSWDGAADFTADEDSILWVCTVNNAGSYNFLWTETNGDCFDTASILVNFIEQPDADISSDDSIACSPEINIITENSVGVGQWETISGPGTLSFSPDANADDVIITADSYGDFKVKWTLMNELCADSDSITISFIENPQVDAGPDQNLDNEFETTMEADLPANMTGEWLLLSGTGDFNDLYSPQSSVYNLSLGENIFSWTVRNGACLSNDSVSIFIFDIFIPDLLTPNGDGDNDYFEISGIENVEPVEVTIFNRWGVEVFHSDNYQNDWDGTGKSGEYLTNDTYFYVVNINNEQRVFKGFMMLTE